MEKQENQMSKDFYSPYKYVIKHANVKEYDNCCRFSIEKREEFWEIEANKLQWYKKWDKVLDDAENKQGCYLAGDSAKKDKDGYYWIIGRMDDVIKVSGYRLGSAVSEAAAIGLPHELKGNAIHAYVILKKGFETDKALETELSEHIVKEIGPIAKPEKVIFTESLPKTRSVKIMRRVLKARALGKDEGDLSTLERVSSAVTSTFPQRPF